MSLSLFSGFFQSGGWPNTRFAALWDAAQHISTCPYVGLRKEEMAELDRYSQSNVKKWSLIFYCAFCMCVYVY